MGLTGVGKSTAVAALQTGGVPLTLLPNRRTLTDTLIIPEVQRAAGEPVQAVKDRIERFDLTKRYREMHPGGMVHALGRYLQTAPAPPVETDTVVFDNLRGLEEAQAGVKMFPEARFILLDAPPLVRLLRLVGRDDSFDHVSVKGPKSTSFTEQLLAIDKLGTVFDPGELATLAAQGVRRSNLLKAVRVILSEAENYDMTAAAEYLRRAKDAHSFLYLDTTKMSVDDVQARIQRWL